MAIDELNLGLLRSDLQNRIKEALELRDWNLLEKWARQWIQLEPQSPQGFKWLARSTMALNKMKRAAYAYGRVLDFEKDNEEALRFFKEFPSSAQQDIDKPSQSAGLPTKKEPTLSLKQKQNLSQKEYDLAKAYFEIGILDRASEHFLRSFDWYPNKNSALESGRTLHLSKRSQEAILFLNQQLLQEPKWIEGRILLGRIYMEIGKNTDAQREWQWVLSQDPANTEALQMLRNIYLTNR